MMPPSALPWLERIAPRAGRADLLVALALGALAFAGLTATTDVGFPRDEGFYFRFARHYQAWFYDVEHELASEGPAPSLMPKRVSEVWRGNAEHPPLAKVAFGYAWRAFSSKIRPLSRIEERAGEALVFLTDLHVADGFDIGEKVWLLRPQVVGEREEAAQRVVGEGTVLDFSPPAATVRIDSGELSVASWERICRPANQNTIPTAMSGCLAMPQRGAWVAESTGFRLPAFLWSSLLVAAIYLFGAVTVGRLAALFAALAFYFVPRHFFHAHMTAFDMPVTAMMFFTVVAFWHSLQSRRWAWAAGVIWGLAILTKHNAWFTPLTLGLWWLGASIRDARHLPPGQRWGIRAWWRRAPLAFITMLAVGLPLFVVLWPRLWYNGLENFRWYVAFHTKHEHYMQQYFGQVLAYPPFPILFPAMLTLLTVPLSTLGFIGAGLGTLCQAALEKLQLGRRGQDTIFAALLGQSIAPSRGVFGVTSLLLVQAVWPIALIALPHTPVFGGVKHWLPAMPFLCLIGGLGFAAAFRGLLTLAKGSDWGAGMRASAAIALLMLAIAPGARATWHAHPQGTAYWNELAGGIRGAASLGMQRQFWGYSTRQALDFLNAHVPKGGTVYFHKSVRDAYDMYKKEELLRADIQHVGDLFDFNTIEQRLRRTSFAVIHHQKDHDEYELAIWRAYNRHTPDWQVTFDGVPLVSVYRNPAIAPP